MCTIEADVTAVEKTMKYNDTTGSYYYQTRFSIVLLFGLTELKAQIAYMENVRIPCDIYHVDLF